MSTIVLATLNARYIHAAVGLRHLFANLGELQERAVIAEFEASQPAREIVESLLDHNPSIIGFGVYIWNTARTREVISLLKRIRPEIVVVVGGPEVSFEYEKQPIVELSDYLITGEADIAFADLCRKLLAGDRVPLRASSASPRSIFRFVNSTTCGFSMSLMSSTSGALVPSSSWTERLI